LSEALAELIERSEKEKKSEANARWHGAKRNGRSKSEAD
jgi:hypothetical protein